MNTGNKVIELFCADDEIADRALLEISVKELNESVNINFAENGVDAVRILTATDDYLPDYILLDLKMPFKDGLECLEEIRRNPRFEHTPVIMFSSSTDPKDVAKAYTLGANVYMQKPFSMDTQLQLLKKLFSWTRFFPQPPIKQFLWET